MFVHLGGDLVVDVREVVAILDIRRLHRAPDARALLRRAAERTGDPAALAAARTLVVSTRGLHPTPFAPATVARRIALRRDPALGEMARK